MKKFYLLQVKSSGSDLGWVEKGRFDTSKKAVEEFNRLIINYKCPDDEGISIFLPYMTPYSVQDQIEVRLLSAVATGEGGYIPHEIMDYQIC